MTNTKLQSLQREKTGARIWTIHFDMLFYLFILLVQKVDDSSRHRAMRLPLIWDKLAFLGLLQQKQRISLWSWLIGWFTWVAAVYLSINWVFLYHVCLSVFKHGEKPVLNLNFTFVIHGFTSGQRKSTGSESNIPALSRPRLQSSPASCDMYWNCGLRTSELSWYLGSFERHELTLNLTGHLPQQQYCNFSY